MAPASNGFAEVAKAVVGQDAALEARLEFGQRGFGVLLRVEAGDDLLRQQHLDVARIAPGRDFRAFTGSEAQDITALTNMCSTGLLSKSTLWAEMVRRGMRLDYGWDTAARRYIETYEAVLA